MMETLVMMMVTMILSVMKYHIYWYYLRTPTHTYIYTTYTHHTHRGTGVTQLVARSTPDRCVVGSSPTCGTEHFGFPPSALRLGYQRPWYVRPRLCDWAYKGPVPRIEKRRGLSPGGRFPPSFIQVIIITGLNKSYDCMFSP